MVVLVAVVGFVPCEDKHRIKAALWQRFVETLTLERDVCSELSVVPEKSGEGPAR